MYVINFYQLIIKNYYFNIVYYYYIVVVYTALKLENATK